MGEFFVCYGRYLLPDDEHLYSRYLLRKYSPERGNRKSLHDLMSPRTFWMPRSVPAGAAGLQLA